LSRLSESNRRRIHCGVPQRLCCPCDMRRLPRYRVLGPAWCRVPMSLIDGPTEALLEAAASRRWSCRTPGRVPSAARARRRERARRTASGNGPSSPHEMPYSRWPVHSAHSGEPSRVLPHAPGPVTVTRRLELFAIRNRPPVSLPGRGDCGNSWAPPTARPAQDDVSDNSSRTGSIVGMRRLMCLRPLRLSVRPAG